MAKDKRLVAEVEDEVDVQETVVSRKEKKIDARPIRSFRLKVGFHAQRSKDPNKPYIYPPGSIIKSRADLVKLHGAEKFEEIGDQPSFLTPNRPVTKPVEYEIHDEEDEDTADTTTEVEDEQEEVGEEEAPEEEAPKKSKRRGRS